MKVGPRVKAVREAKTLSQEYVAGRLKVVHTTIHMYEKSPDLKSATIKKLAAVLEVNHAYLTGDVPDLEALPVEHVVRRESLRIFLQDGSTSDRERRQFERVRDHRLAPVTVEKWRELRAFIHQMLGRPPDRAPVADHSATADGEQPATLKRRMARVPVARPANDDRLRRVG